MEPIKYEDFKKLDLRIAEIIKVEKIENTDKLLKLTINLGEKTQEIVSGIALQYNIEDLIGKQIVVLTNLEPKTLKGVESNGMLLAAVNEKNDKIALLVPDKKMEPGDLIK
jgi:methionyl-tRNA synthetase